MLNCIEILVRECTSAKNVTSKSIKLNNFRLDYGQQYTTTVTQKPIQSTYRPSTVSTQPPPRETYVKQEHVYEQRPVNSYNPEYDESLISQVMHTHNLHFSVECTFSEQILRYNFSWKGIAPMIIRQEIN